MKTFFDYYLNKINAHLLLVLLIASVGNFEVAKDVAVFALFLCLADLCVNKIENIFF